MSLLLSSFIIAWAPPSSTLVNTKWRVKLDLGLEEGSWMPNTIEGWGASGGRCIVNVDVSFDEKAAGRSEELVGPEDMTRSLTAGSASSIVTTRGEEQIQFASGGWCVQRTMFGKPEDQGELRFWLDCVSGASRGDVSVPANERLYFCTQVFDDAKGLAQALKAKQLLEKHIETLEEEYENGDDALPRWAPKELGGLPLIGQALGMQRKMTRVEERLELRRQRASYDRTLPFLGVDDRAAQMAEKGSISLKRTRGEGMFAKSAYHILGTFTVEPILERR